MDQSFLRLEADRFVEHLQRPGPDSSTAPPRIEWIHAARGLPSVSIQGDRVMQFGVCVSVQAIVDASYGPELSAQVLATAFAIVKGKPVRQLRYHDAVILDWCWRNRTDNLIYGKGIVNASGKIADAYKIDCMSERDVWGSIEALVRNHSLVDWEDDRYLLSERVTIWR